MKATGRALKRQKLDVRREFPRWTRANERGQVKSKREGASEPKRSTKSGDEVTGDLGLLPSEVERKGRVESKPCMVISFLFVPGTKEQTIYGCYLIFICSRYKRAHAASSYGA